MPAHSYRSLVRSTGSGFLIMSFLGRLPSAMAPLGLIVLVVEATGSYARAGAATAALGMGAALGGPAVGALSDRLGQRSVGVIAALLNAAALALVLVAVQSRAGMFAVVGLAALAGLSTPQIGPLVRVRWVALLRRDPRAISTAMSYEGAADEFSFVAGPALVGILAVTGVSALPLAVASALTLLASVGFAVHRTAVGRAPRRSSTVRAPLPGRALTVLMVAMLGVGMVFGATQTGVAAFAESAGVGGLAGLIYAVLGVGSALAGFATAYLPARLRLSTRFPLFAAALLASSLVLLTVSSVGSALLAMAVVGLSAAPVLITLYALGGRIAPDGRAGMVMTLLASGTVAGVALGAGFAGPLAGAYGYAGAFAVPVLAGLVTLIASAFGASVAAEPVLDAAPDGAPDGAPPTTAVVDSARIPVGG